VNPNILIEVIDVPMWKFEKITKNGRGKSFCLLQATSLNETVATATVTLSTNRKDVQEFIMMLLDMLEAKNFQLKYKKTIAGRIRRRTRKK